MRILDGSPAYFRRSAPGDFVVVRYRGSEVFLARDRWLSLPEWTTAASSDKTEIRSRGARGIAALFLLLTVLRAVETTITPIGRFFRKIGGAGFKSRVPASKSGRDPQA